MWTKEMFGTDFYHLIAAFIVYSMLGWLVESIYMSFCNKKLTNRGFAKGPFCPIYG
ncbi:MAG: putative ABC transporter permease, partial [Acetatifactor sp.]|nr:putative ABC transporter permease [Acetatifactor sp.]